MASSSSSSSGRRCRYDVFLNFRGEDTRRSFVCHLHSALTQKLLNPFIDAEDLRIGNYLSDLLNAITDSKISIVVFSQDYASSTWCLKELVQIMKCKVEQEQIVVPVFYQVDPSDIRKQKGAFGEAFVKHESNQDLQEVQSWRLALAEATNLSGLDSRNYKDDAKLIDAIVDHVFKECFRISSSKNNHWVGMDSHLCEMRQLLRLKTDDDDVLIVGIWGMGGIGKTTIATEVYDEIRSQFDHYFFLRNVKEGFSSDHVRMQENLVCGMLNEKKRIDTLKDGYKLMEGLSNKKVLLVLDDVDNSNQIETLLGHEPSFGGGSRIIITTRDRSILNGCKRYEVKFLRDGDALTLFNRYAFKRNKPSGEYDHSSRRAVEYAQGLPLALRILGSHLVDGSVSEWEEELDKIEKLPNLGIQRVLRTSFDGLDDSQKKLFLDIACFFKGIGTDYVTKILGNCDGFYVRTGLRALVEKALVTISKFGGIEMHDLLQEVGRGIVQSEKPWKHSRLCSYEAVQDVSTRNKCMKVEGIMVKLSNSEDTCLDAESFDRMTNLRLLRITYPHRDQFDKFLRFEGGSRWPDQYLMEAENCKQQLNGHPTFFSPKLRGLTWHGCPLQSLPSNFNPKNLVDLDMRYSHIEQLWQGRSAKELISINLSYCPYLNKIPPCTEAPKLEKLFLECCISLLEVDPSISALENLVFLSLTSCTNLKTLPNSIVHLKSLKSLNLLYCSNLETFPEILEDMEALLNLELGYSGIRVLPSSIERLRRLESLSMTHCNSLVCLPDSICNLAELSVLELRFCSKLCNLPENFGNLQSLRVLNVLETGLKQLPVSILRLKLGTLSFHGCQQMEAPLASWPSSIEDRCTAVVRIDLSWTKLLELPYAIAHCSYSLKQLSLSNNNLESLPAIMIQLVCLEHLELEDCKRLKSIPELSSSISYINAHGCTALETVSTPKRPYDVGRCFIFSNCSQLVQEDLFRDFVETHFPPQGNYSRPFYMCFPGTEIPAGWFRHKCRGSSVTAQLPPNWFDNKLWGFALCAVTNTPRNFDRFTLSAQCICTFKGDNCEYRFSFYLLDSHFGPGDHNSLESNHMLLGYVPWSEFGINGREEVNERRYTEATFQLKLCQSKGYYINPPASIEWCGVRLFFANNEEVFHQDFGDPMVHSKRRLEWCSAEPSGSAITSDTSDEDEQYLKLSEFFGGANRNSIESYYESDESDCEIEDNDSSGKRKILSRWTQQVRVTSGLMQGDLDDGFSWRRYEWADLGTGDRTRYSCDQPSCYAKSKKIISNEDPTILEITYIGRHTCWKTQPMLTHQVRVKSGMGPEGPFDGFSWREYGQKDFRGAKYPRVYYVCIPQNVQGCMAIKEVQPSDDDPQILKITYRGTHTCIQASTFSIGGRGDGRISEGGGALRTHDQVVQSPRSLGDNGSGGNVIRLADRAMDDNNVIMLPAANSQDMEHFQDVNHMANKDVAGYPNHGGVVSEDTSDAVVNQSEEEDPMDFSSLKKRKREMNPTPFQTIIHEDPH